MKAKAVDMARGFLLQPGGWLQFVVRAETSAFPRKRAQHSSANKETNKQTNRQSNKETGKQTDRQTDKHANTQTTRQTDKRIDKTRQDKTKITQSRKYSPCDYLPASSMSKPCLSVKPTNPSIDSTHSLTCWFMRKASKTRFLICPLPISPHRKTQFTLAQKIILHPQKRGKHQNPVGNPQFQSWDSAPNPRPHHHAALFVLPAVLPALNLAGPLTLPAL